MLENTNTLAHELIARDEQFVGVFFSAFTIQYYLSKRMLKENLNVPAFLKFYGDVELSASHRVFIKNIIAHPQYQEICREIGIFLINLKTTGKESRPYEMYLSKIHKSFLIRQIFQHSDQVLDKYRFVSNFLGKEIASIDLANLHKQMEHLPAEQQVLVLVRIFSQLNDELVSKRKTIMASFLENIEKLMKNLKDTNKKDTVEYQSLDKLYDHFTREQ